MSDCGHPTLRTGDTFDLIQRVTPCMFCERDRLRAALSEAFQWLCPPRGVERAGPALRRYLREIMPMIGMGNGNEAQCQHDLLKPDTTIEVIDKWKAKCKVCIEFFDLSGRPSVSEHRAAFFGDEP